MSTSRSEHLTVGYAAQSNAGQARSTSPTASTSPAESATSTGPPIRSPFGMPGGLGAASKMVGASRSGAGSPSHDMAASGGRLFSKRAREIQAQEGLPVNPWGGPPTSGNSTPLRENIPESPTDGFPDFQQLPPPDVGLPTRGRTRAGTLPSRFPGASIPNNGLLGLPNLASKSQRPTPSQSPFKSPSPGLTEPTDSAATQSALLSRLRAGSMPQRSPFSHVPGTSSPFGPSIFSTWNPSGGRERATTLASIASMPSNGPSSPAQSAFSRDGGLESDVHMRTLDYLGLAETPQQPRAHLATPYIPHNINDLRQSSRIRSYSVNNKDKYADDEEDEYDEDMLQNYNSYAARAAQLQNQIAATNAAIQHHNMAVQALASQQTAMNNNRPRARTVAGIMDPPPAAMLGQYYNPGAHLDPSLAPAEIRLMDDKEHDDLPQAVAAMSLGRSNSRNNGLLNPDEQGLEGPTSALWLGSIPTSTTTSTLTEMFKSYGPILSVRVLTHKNCGFVNFERTDSAIAAKNTMNGKEIFPGAGPIRINFAKPPSASNTPGPDGVFPSPSPDPFAKGEVGQSVAAASAGETATPAPQASSVPTVRPLREMTTEIIAIVKQFGASEADAMAIHQNLIGSINFTDFTDEIPPIKEPAHTRVHDAPKLRDIRKRIDNQSLSPVDIENVALDMLPEIAELSSDYLGNTVVQKLFEHCSDGVKDLMLREIAPHMAEIGVHKNGTWAAQKIIDVCGTPEQKQMIVEYIRPYTVPLFLDQYGNYVLQGCLKFGPPFNDFIFETMLSRMWEIAQGRYGARAMRACLESHHASKNQQRMLAAAIALHSTQLATNANGALLLTWFLDTCNYSVRRTVIAPLLVPSLVHLCTHKVAYLTVLKVINQKTESEGRDILLKALFFTPKDHVLEAILSDHACGATLIFKVLTTPFFDEAFRNKISENVKNVLVRIKAQPNQGYKRLMDEVGLSTRNGGSGGRDLSAHGERTRPTSRQTNMNGHSQQPGQQFNNNNNQQQQQQFYNQMNNTSNQASYDLGYNNAQQRNEGGDSSMQPFPSFGNNPMFNSSNPGVVPMQYQQNMMGNRGTPNNYFPNMPPNFPGYNSSNPAAIDQFRGQNMGNAQGSAGQMPNMPNSQAPFAPPPGFGPNPMGMSGFGYNGGAGGGMQNMGFMQQEQVGTRRGRVSTPRAATPGSKKGSRSRDSSRY